MQLKNKVNCSAIAYSNLRIKKACNVILQGAEQNRQISSTS